MNMLMPVVYSRTKSLGEIRRKMKKTTIMSPLRERETNEVKGASIFIKAEDTLTLVVTSEV